MQDLMSSINTIIEEKVVLMVDSDQIKVKPCQGCDPKILSQLIKKGILDNKNNETKTLNSPKKHQTNSSI